MTAPATANWTVAMRTHGNVALLQMDVIGSDGAAVDERLFAYDLTTRQWRTGDPGDVTSWNQHADAPPTVDLRSLLGESVGRG
jgi:hypothetical protein